jgi:hypothetical protein
LPAWARRVRARIEAKVSGKPQEKEPKGISLEQLGLVVAGCKGDAQALQRPGSRQEYVAVGKALQRILEGTRTYDEVGKVVRGVLEQIA